MEAGYCPPLNMNAMHNYLLSQSLRNKFRDKANQCQNVLLGVFGECFI